MTNEFVFGYTFIGFPNVFQDPVKVDRKAIGYNVQGLFKNGIAQFPNLAGSSSEAANISTNGGFEVGGPRGMSNIPALVDSGGLGIFWVYLFVIVVILVSARVGRLR